MLPGPSTSRSVPAGTSSTSTFKVARSGASSSVADPRHQRFPHLLKGGDRTRSVSSPRHRGARVRCCVRASGVAVALAVLALAVVAATRGNPSPPRSRPTAVIDSPTPDVTWKVGDTITFAGSGIDAQGQPIPPSGMSWALIVHHCSTSCHEHGVQSFPGVADGSFVAPGHDYPSYLELRLTVTDAGGLSGVATVPPKPRTADV